MTHKPLDFPCDRISLIARAFEADDGCISAGCKESFMSDAKVLKSGDVVCLNSGGPPMTVETITDHVWVNCIWFDGCILRKQSFMMATVKSFTVGAVNT